MPMNGNKSTEQQALQERQKFVTAFNDTMLKIWQEQITLLGVIDTGALLASPRRCRCVPMVAFWRSDCPSPFSNTACGRTTARAARRPVATPAILAEPRNANAAAGSPASITPQSCD